MIKRSSQLASTCLQHNVFVVKVHTMIFYLGEEEPASRGASRNKESSSDSPWCHKDSNGNLKSGGYLKPITEEDASPLQSTPLCTLRVTEGLTRRILSNTGFTLNYSSVRPPPRRRSISPVSPALPLMTGLMAGPESERCRVSGWCHRFIYYWINRWR